MVRIFLLYLLGIFLWNLVFAQQGSPPNSFPHAWLGQPETPFGPEWQDCKLCHLSAGYCAPRAACWLYDA